MGPLFRSKQGHTWLLNMQGRFSKWVELCPLRQATAPKVARHIAQTVILRHGRPEIIMSDNGTQLKSQQLENLLAAINIQYAFTPLHSPHCNPVERTNQTIKTMIAQYVEKNHKN